MEVENINRDVKSLSKNQRLALVRLDVIALVSLAKLIVVPPVGCGHP